MRIQVPRVRAGSFAPRIVPKHVRRLDGFNEAILSLYAKGLTTGEISAHLADVYDADVSRELISRVTDSVLEEMEAWRQRPLDRAWLLSVIANAPEGERSDAEVRPQQDAELGEEAVL